MPDIISNRNAPYPMHVASPPIRIENIEHWKKNIIMPLMNSSIERFYNTLAECRRSKEILKRLSVEKNSENIATIIGLESQNFTSLKSDLIQLHDNYRMYNILQKAELYHVPAMNTGYHVYKKDCHEFISLIAPNEWKSQYHYLGSFIYHNMDFKIYKEQFYKPKMPSELDVR